MEKYTIGKPTQRKTIGALFLSGFDIAACLFYVYLARVSFVQEDRMFLPIARLTAALALCAGVCPLAEGIAAAGPADTSSALSVCVFPFQPSNIPQGDVSMITDALRMKLSARERLDVLDKEKSLQAWLFARHGGDSVCTGADCIVSAGQRAGVRYAVGGSIGRIGTLYTFSAAVFDVTDKKRIFNREYEYTGTIEEFYSDVPRRVANDIFAKLTGASEKQEQTPKGRDPAVPQAPLSGEYHAEEPAPRNPLDQNRGIVLGPTFGASGRIAIGPLSATQSRWGACIFFLYPTTASSQLRIKLGAPLSGSDTMFRDYSSVTPDLYGSIEHEWGMPHFGVGFGVAVTRMQAFHKTYYLSSIYYDQNGMMIGPGPDTIPFRDTYAFNWVATLRGGRPNAGFLGRISWPMPINPASQNLENAFFEYSALGVFGGSAFKGGIGLQGMIKNRNVTTGIGTLSLEDSYILAPCGKFAVLLGKQSVFCASIDLGSILFPRPDNGSWWAPNVQIDYTFSLKPLTGPSVLDGTF
jgi:hypothetical protein